MTFGEKISPVLVEIENTLWEFDLNVSKPAEYTDDGFKAAVKIFFSAMMDKLWKLQQEENMPIPDRYVMSNKMGEEINRLIKIYTNYNTKDFYKK